MIAPRPLLGIIVLVAASTLMVGCSSDHGPELEPGSGVPVTGSVALEPAVDHVHGAVVMDGSLLLGTHSGLVEVDPATGATQRRGTSQDDLMGLAADGATLLASGHPGPGTDLPDPLGLLRSDDGGQTWTPVSLTGEVDFHGLTADGDRIAGIGTEHGVKVSDDGGATWQEVGIEDATSLAWFQDALWVTTASGFTAWTEETGPRSAQSATSTQPLAVAAADDGSALWAVHPDGSVWRTRDGATWDQAGAVAALEALAATADTAYAVTADTVTPVTAG